jgi:hypothetical protein
MDTRLLVCLPLSRTAAGFSFAAFRVGLFLVLLLVAYPRQVAAQSATGGGTATNTGPTNTSVTNNAAPAANVATNTNGGTNINYQTNNQWSNDVGLGAGVVCRTPTFYIGGSAGDSLNNTVQGGNYANGYSQNFSGNMGLLIPFGSSVLDDCKRIASAVALDRQISSQLTMLRTCVGLEKDGLAIDKAMADTFPMLARCLEYKTARKMIAQASPESTPAPPVVKEFRNLRPTGGPNDPLRQPAPVKKVRVEWL